MVRKVDTHEFVERALKAHAGKYSYDKTEYQHSKKPVAIRCGIHGIFWQSPGNHLMGAGCPICAGRGVDWVARFRTVHGALYDYTQVVYEDYKKKVKIGCSLHGFFEQTPDNHYRGKQGCPECKGARIQKTKQMPIAEFVQRATIVHAGAFTYGSQQFTNMLTGRAHITCPLHGDFTQSPVNHLAGKVGCVQCSNTKSKQESRIADFLSTFTPVISRDRTVLKPKELDIYLPEKKLAVEYSGMFWHSHFDAPDEKANWRNHASKYAACKEQGIRLLTIYESEWQGREPALRRLLRNAVGKSKGKLMARKCVLRKVELRDAKAFYEKYHPQGGAGYGEHYGLYWSEKLVACMRFARGVNDRGAAAKERTWTLARYATRITVAGAASRLFKAFRDEFSPTEVKSFSDNRYFGGEMYTALGFTLEKEVGPDYQVWSPKLGLLPKPSYQRRVIPTRLEEHGIADAFNPATDPRTEAEMTYLMGCGRIYDCGKKRWRWVA